MRAKRLPFAMSLLRRAGVTLAAYLIIAQAALAGLAPHHGLSVFDPTALCVTDAGAASPGGATPDAMLDCCGIGCLGTSALMPSPRAPDEALRHPALDAIALPADAPERASTAPHERTGRPRGPPGAV